MGLFTSKLHVWNPANPTRVEEFEVWVDTGASYSWLSRHRLEVLGIRPTRREQFRTIEGRLIERELAPVFVRVDGHIGGDTVVLAEPGDAEVMGSFTLESVGLAVDPVQKKLVPTIGLALSAVLAKRQRKPSRVVQAIDAAIEAEELREPFSNDDFRRACSGFGKGTCNAFLWKHRRGNPDRKSEFFELVRPNQFCRIRE